MKILYDYQAFSQRYGGVPKYFVEVMKRLDSSTWKLSNFAYHNHDLFESKLCNFFYSSNIRLTHNRITRKINKLNLEFDVKGGKYDIYHPTHYSIEAYKFLPKNKKIVSTMHDMNFLAIPEYYSSNYDKNVLQEQKDSALMSDKLVAVSHNTKNDLIRFWNIDESKIEVIHHGINRIDSALLPQNRIVDFPYILYVGTRFNFKNFKPFLKSFSDINQQFKDIHLVCTGYDFDGEELSLISKLSLDSKIHLMKVNNDMLNCLYRDAELFVYPSLYEGFGMPILEAMANGCPVALSNTSCFPEIAGDAASYFDPYNIDSISKICIELLEDSKSRKELIVKGLEKVNDYSWNNTAEKHYKLYKSLM